MKKVLASLLNDMDRIAEDFEEVTDTAVREYMGDSIFRGWMQPQKGYQLPERFAMFSDEGNAAVRAALVKFIEAANREADRLGLLTPHDRLNAFQDPDIESREGNTYDEYFGHRDNVL